ncbi:hypothetical protein, partial [Rhizobium leguminosarum]|uniref:hypothetical protein n=1 Tax=Rhizobium leguminosarum TaxID=384 RepID=UPI003F9CD85A
VRRIVRNQRDAAGLFAGNPFEHGDEGGRIEGRHLDGADIGALGLRSEDCLADLGIEPVHEGIVAGRENMDWGNPAAIDQMNNMAANFNT